MWILFDVYVSFGWVGLSLRGGVADLTGGDRIPPDGASITKGFIKTHVFIRV